MASFDKKVGKFGRLIEEKDEKRSNLDWRFPVKESFVIGLMEVDDLGDECDSFDSGN